MESHEFADLGVLGLVAEGKRRAETIYDQLQTEFESSRNISYMKCTSILLRFNEEDYIEPIEHTEYSSATTSQNTQDNKKYYTITQSGRNYLHSLLQSPIKEITNPAHHSQLLMKIRFLHHLPEGKQDDQLAHFEDQLYQARNKLIENDTTRKTDNHEYDEYRQATADIRIRILDEYLDWIKNVRHSLSTDSSRDL